MSVLNLNSIVYEEIKMGAKNSMRKIGDHAAYLALIGKHFSENKNMSFEQIENMVLERIKGLKITA